METHVIDKRTKKLAVIFDLGEIRRPDQDHAEVAGGYYCADLCIGSGTYFIERKSDHWAVTRFDIRVQALNLNDCQRGLA